MSTQLPPIQLIRADITRHLFDVILKDPERRAQAAEALANTMTRKDAEAYWLKRLSHKAHIFSSED